MSKKVKYARLQTAAHVPGVGELGNTIPSNKTLENLEMTTDGNSLSIKFTHKGAKKEVCVPGGNIILMEVVPSEN